MRPKNNPPIWGTEQHQVGPPRALERSELHCPRVVGVLGLYQAPWDYLRWPFVAQNGALCVIGSGGFFWDALYNIIKKAHTVLINGGGRGGELARC